MKGNKARRTVANDLVNKFINHPNVGIHHIRVSQAGNFEIKAQPYKITGVKVKLRVNLTTLTYTFEFYGQHGSSCFHNTMSKRKPINTSFIPDSHNFFYAQLEYELRLIGAYKGERKCAEMYIGDWLPDPVPTAPEVPDCLKEYTESLLPDYVRYAAESMTKTHGTAGIWGRDTQLQTQEHEQLRRNRHVDILKAVHARGSTVEKFKASAQQYEQLQQRGRDGTPLFTDEQFDELYTDSNQKYNMLPSELNASYPDLDIIAERTTTGEVKYCVAAKKLTDEEVKYLFDDAQRPHNNKLHEIMNNIAADGRVTISIDQSDADKVMLDIIDDTTKSVCDAVRAEIKKSKGDR